MPTWRLDREEITDVRVFSGIFFPLLAGFAFLGWRAVILIGLVILGAQSARWILCWLLTWPAQLSVLSINIRSAVVAMFMPAQLIDIDLNPTSKYALWSIPITIGICLTILTWATTRLSTLRINAIVLASIFSIFVCDQFVHNDRVLQRDHVFRGNLLDEHAASRINSAAEPWLRTPLVKNTEVLQMDSASDQINRYLNREEEAKQDR